MKLSNGTVCLIDNPDAIWAYQGPDFPTGTILGVED